MGVVIDMPRHRKPPDGNGGRKRCLADRSGQGRHPPCGYQRLLYRVLIPSAFNLSATPALVAPDSRSTLIRSAYASRRLENP